MTESQRTGRFNRTRRGARTRWATGVWFGSVALGLVCGGCGDDARVVRAGDRHVVVTTVTDAGITLDESADPAKVVYVLLRAIKDDVDAGDDRQAREAAFARELQVCAPDTIFARSLRQSLGRAENIRQIVWHWAPTLAHYTNDFPRDWPEAQHRLVTSNAQYRNDPNRDRWTRVYLELADPSGDPNASVIAQFELVREADHWRVVQVGFVRERRHLREIKNAVSDRAAAGVSDGKSG